MELQIDSCLKRQSDANKRTFDAYVETEALDNCLVLASFRLATVQLESLEIGIVAVQLDRLLVVDHVVSDKLHDDYFVVDL